MSGEILEPPASTIEDVREQLEEITEPHTKSRQAHGEIDSNRHTDGQHLHNHFGIPPLHKWLEKQARRDPPASVVQYPRAFVDNILYTDSRDLQLLRELAGEVEYDYKDPHPSHDALERYEPMRAKLMEWVASDEDRVNAIRSSGGTDLWAHGEPGGGKTTLFLSIAVWRMENNNETYIWSESLDDSGTNERTEWLPMAPFATIAAPAGLDPIVRIVPKDTTVPTFEVELEEIARDVIYYDSVQDLMEQLLPGQFYVIYPDPLHRGAQDVDQHNYYNFREADPHAENVPDYPTPADQWWFAFFAHRISGDVFVHPTFINLDEAGNLLDPDAERNEHQHYDKVVKFAKKYADARKKGVSFGYQSHALSELHPDGRAKIRWRVTMNGTSPPTNRKLPGDRTCPMNADRTSNMRPGEAQIWKEPNFATIKWPDLKSKAQLDAEVSIDFRNWQDAVGGA